MQAALRLVALAGVLWSPLWRTTQVAGSHTPPSWRPFTSLPPNEAADALRQCLKDFGGAKAMNHTARVTSPWAGRMLDDQEMWPGVVTGPLLPKVMTTSMRVWYGGVPRPNGLVTAEAALAADGAHATRPRNLWLAIVRDPLTRFVDAYAQAGTFTWTFYVPGTNEKCSFLLGTTPDDGSKFCAQPEACRRAHAENWILDHNINSNGRQHRVHQMNYLAEVAGRLDAVVRMETLSDDWALTVALSGNNSAFRAEATRSLAGLQKNIGSRLRAKPGLHVAPAASGTAVPDACVAFQRSLDQGLDQDETEARQLFPQLLQANLLQWLTPALLQQLCKYLVLDFACLRYPLPAVCQLAGAQGHNTGTESKPLLSP